MAVYSRDVIAGVLDAVDLVEIVAGALQLQPAGGGRLKGLCPFHTEKTPSFTVNRHEQRYYCFGCNKGGDALSFIQEHEGLTFMEALQKLADRGNYKLPALTERDDKVEYLRKQLLAFGKFASAHFRGLLLDPQIGAHGRQYLQARDLQDATTEQFQLGYVPEGWSNLLDATRAKGFGGQVVDGCGLFKRGDHGSYDFFRNRVIFPIRDISGNVVAFGGRDLGDSPAKYINSPETAVYKKSKVLYGLYEARDALRREDYALLVEGYFDLLRCFDVGIQNVVASCGTALTPEQASLIRRYVKQVVIVYDGDAAGIKAAMKGCGVLVSAGLTVRAMALPDGQDPDDYIRTHGADAFLDRVKQAPDFVQFYADMSGDFCRTIEGRTQVAEDLFAIVQHIESELRRDEYLKHVADALGLNQGATRMEYTRFIEEGARRAPRREAGNDEGAAKTAPSMDDCLFIAALIAHEGLRARVREAIEGQGPAEGVCGVVLEALLLSDAGARAIEDEDAARLYAAAANIDGVTETDAAALVEKRLKRMERDMLTAEAARVQRELQEAERANDASRVSTLLMQKIELARQLDRVGAA